ncbi:hypothetical protein SAMN05216226_1188 [Halovenus aranensis]|uniref:Ribbon-helix-helix protein, copG family n=1 Tax=Halovenus aranensis TaxID=890420 RepID=A0A1G8Z4M9_9EURY|nr:hypothetical protein SAMN05216226_1188 [Halovenus aranensis]
MRTSFNIPDDLHSEFDETWQAEGLDSRSRAVREAMQEYIEGHTRLEDIEGDVVVIIAFNYEHEAVIEEVHDVHISFRTSSRPRIIFTKESGVSRHSSAADRHRESGTSRIACAISMR